MTETVAVVIPAFNAEPTIGRAVRSALLEQAVAEVVVVDDCSSDGTESAARAADDGTGRLRVHRLSENAGPAAARNHGFSITSAPLIAILDADDFFMSGRLDLLQRPSMSDWDFLGDNSLFIDSATAAQFDGSADLDDPDLRLMLDLPTFLKGNVSRPGQNRTELGFLKPIIRREALVRLGLAYEPALRLGEDFIFYATALARGARFELSLRCGYVAVERPNSLSGRHSPQDLDRLARATARLLGDVRRPGTLSKDAARSRRQAEAALRAVLRGLRAKVNYRNFLDAKARVGLVRALIPGMIINPRRALDVAQGYVRDRRHPTDRPGPSAHRTRRLLDLEDFLD